MKMDQTKVIQQIGWTSWLRKTKATAWQLDFSTICKPGLLEAMDNVTLLHKMFRSLDA